MTTLYYDSTDRLALADEPFLPEDEESIESLHFKKELVSIDEWKTYYVKVYGEKDIPFLDSGKFFVNRNS